MKIGVIGIGAIGGYFGAKLAKAGLDVTFIGRENTVEQLKEKGISIKSYQGDFKISKPKAFHSFETIADADIILLCVKSYHTESIAKALKDRISNKAVIISLQNGINNEKILAKIFGEQRVIGASLFVSCAMLEACVVKHTAYGKIIMGELNGEVTERISDIQKLFLNANIPVEISKDINKELWKKLILNFAYNGFTALIGKPLEKYFEIEEAQECFIRAIKEAQKVAIAEGQKITDADIEDLIAVTKSPGFTTFKTSTLQDIERGKPVEIDDIQGAIIKAAQKHNIDVPVNKMLYSLLKLKY